MNRRSFITQKEAWILVAKQHPIPLNQIRTYLFQQILKSGLMKKRAYGLARTIMDVNGMKKNLIGRDDYLKFRTSFEIRYRALAKEPNPHAVFFKIQYFLKKIEEFLILDHSLNGDHCVLVDEGMLHQLSGLNQNDYDLYTSEEIEEDEALNPDGVILCEQSEDTIYRQCRQRKNNGESRYSIYHLTDEELKQHIKRSIINHKSKIRFFEIRNIPVLRINPGDELETNIIAINGFIEKL